MLSAVQGLSNSCVPVAAGLRRPEEPIRELFCVVRQDHPNTHWAGPLQISREAPRVGRCLCSKDANGDPPGRPVNSPEKVTSTGLISHPGQVFHVNVAAAGFTGPGSQARVHRPGFTGLEGAVFGAGRFDLEITQVANAMSPQATVQTRP